MLRLASSLDRTVRKMFLGNSRVEKKGEEEREGRRKAVRFDIGIPAQLGDGTEERQEEIWCKDMSSGGVCFLSRHPRSPGSIRSVTLSTSTSDKPLKVMVEVVWCSNQLEVCGNFHGYGVGTRFLRNNGHRLYDNDIDTLLHTFVQNLKATELESHPIGSTSRWKFPYERFIYEKHVFLKHTNVEGNTYYDNYVAWHGEAREALLLSHPHVQEFLKSKQNVKMITHSLYQHYIKDTFFGDVIRIEVTSREIKTCSFVMIFRYYDKRSNVLVGEGWQKICFADLSTGEICRTPQLILDLIEPIEEKG